MKNAVSFLALALAFTALTAFTFSGSNDFVGSKSCKACHSNAKMGGTAYKTWEGSSHAKALASLKTPEADKIATEKGFKTKAADTKECLACHVTSAKDDGVGCESCHGAASAYKSKHGKGKDVADAIAAGMILPKVDDGSAEKQCKTCHNDKSPTFKGFKFKEMWTKIAHAKG
ncbi:MAG: cytochrome C554 [Bacteroidetes bacterium]|nr:cytochrome C554 [Bacteroidota bacterium]